MKDCERSKTQGKIILSHKRYAYWAVLLLTLIGAFCIILRYSISSPDQASPNEDSWQISYQLEFEAEKAGSHIYIALPLDTPDCRVFKTNLRSEKRADGDKPRFKTTLLEPSSRHCDRELKLTASDKGKYQIAADLGIHSNRQKQSATNEVTDKLQPEKRNRYLTSEPGVQVKSKEVLATFERLHSESISQRQLINRFFEYSHYELESQGNGKAKDAEQALITGKAEVIGKARTFIALCRTAGIPARLVSGFELEETDNASPHFWAETFLNGIWKPYDPENGYKGEIPHHYLVLRRGRQPFVRSVGITDIQKEISISEIHPATGFFSAQLWPGKEFRLNEIFHLRRLPLELQPTLAVLLLFPLAALMTALFKTIIGIDTVGNFTPALLALSFVYTGWRIGALLLILIVSIGLAGRTLLERMKLLLLPRLSVVLTLIILGMILGISIIEHFALTPTAGLVLLPMVITTMIVERFYIAEEEEGFAYSLKLLTGTVFVAFFCYLLLNWQAAGQLILSYPELHFFTMAALILLGSYRGYRLSEIWRFRELRRL